MEPGPKEVGFDVVLDQDAPAQVSVFSCERPTPGTPPLSSFAQNAQRGVAVVLLGRLLYRRDLLARLGEGAGARLASQAGDRAISDAELALQAFLAAGERSFEWLEGEFSLVLLDVRERRVLALRDSVGRWPLFWMIESGAVRVGTSLRRLARRSSSYSINLDHLAAFLMFPYPGSELAREATVLDPVGRLLPGVLLELRPDGRSRPLWQHDWATQPEDRLSVSLPEAGARYAELLRYAVRERIAGEVATAHLSGGMDSSSVACLARDLLGTDGAGGELAGGIAAVAGRRLHTMSLVYGLPGLAGEDHFMRMIIDQGGPLDARFVNGDDALDFDGFRQAIPPHDEPYVGLFRLAMEQLLAEVAEQQGATTILTGSAAELTVELKRNDLADQLREGRLLSLLREARRWAQASNTSPWSILRHHALTPNAPARLREGLGVFLRSGYSRWPSLGLFAIAPWVRPWFARRYGMWGKGLDTIRRMTRYPRRSEFQKFEMSLMAGDWACWNLTAPRGIRISHPFLDQRLIRFAFALPAQVKEMPGVAKPLLQEAMRGILPEPIRTRRYKRNFNDVFWCGLSRNLPALESMVRASRFRELGVLDEEALIDAIRQHALGIGDAMVGGKINTSLAAIAWFDALEKRPSVAVTPSVTHEVGAPGVVAGTVAGAPVESASGVR